ncbi:MAG: hypothetical protein M3Q47_15965, partial [Actinomycetota bacterium]|nr:hypothetical protein [Actinomycetota bacterium]
PVLARPAGRARRSALVGRPAAVLARRLEALAEDRPLSVVVVSPSPKSTPESLVHEVAAELRASALSAMLAAPGGDAADTGPARVRLAVGSPLLPLSGWRRLAGTADAVVVAVAPGQVQPAELAELRTVLTAVGIRPLALVLAAAGSGNAAPAPTARPVGTPGVPARPATPLPTPR